MAIKNTCPKCKKRFSAPDSYVGKKVECPRCGQKVVLRSPEEIRRRAELDEETRRKLDEDRERLKLIERMEIRRRRTTRPYHEAYGTGESVVRHFNPGAPSRFLRLRVLSEVLTFSSYFEVLLALLGTGLTIYLKISGVIPSIGVLLLCLVGWAVVGSTLYLVLKFLGELAFTLSDLGDQQNDLVQLLLDIRDNTESPVEQEG